MNTVYAVDSEYETYIGTYRGNVSTNYMSFKNILWDVTVKIKQNAKKAKESFEQRSLNIILKKLVNEHFRWS